ncbi:hypothetical protein [Dactylosporangium sp. NPDC051541]|uniref:hypothetical protein n=1 Tax=Dactylosporangium sp. NPDC051541 TaxID=3363977 RepID=UPI00378C3FA5
MRRVRFAVAVVVMAGSLSVFGWLAYRGWPAAGAYLAGTLRDRLAGATVESSVPPPVAAQWSRLVGRAAWALGGVVVGVALLPRPRRARRRAGSRAGPGVSRCS